MVGQPVGQGGRGLSSRIPSLNDHAHPPAGFTLRVVGENSTEGVAGRFRIGLLRLGYDVLLYSGTVDRQRGDKSGTRPLPTPVLDVAQRMLTITK